MAHPWFVEEIEQWGNSLTADEFLEQFTPIHIWWHREHGRWNGAPLLGFLSFHHDVIKALKQSFTRSDWNFPPPWTTMQPSYDTWRAGDGRPLNELSDPEEFSREIENWHNFVHMNPIYPELPNPATNIWTWRFWGLHHRIDEAFQDFLNRRDQTVETEQVYENLGDLHATV